VQRTIERCTINSDRTGESSLDCLSRHHQLILHQGRLAFTGYVLVAVTVQRFHQKQPTRSASFKSKFAEALWRLSCRRGIFCPAAFPCTGDRPCAHTAGRRCLYPSPYISDTSFLPPERRPAGSKYGQGKSSLQNAYSPLQVQPRIRWSRGSLWVQWFLAMGARLRVHNCLTFALFEFQMEVVGLWLTGWVAIIGRVQECLKKHRFRR